MKSKLLEGNKLYAKFMFYEKLKSELVTSNSSKS